LSVSGCKLGPDYVRPPVPQQEGWQEKAKTDSSLANLPWWELFKDETLQGLIKTALAENKDAAIMLERIAEARAQAGITNADLYPQVSGAAAAAAINPSDEKFPFETETKTGDLR
jgi:multidrug efflux system outer membrane protein